MLCGGVFRIDDDHGPMCVAPEARDHGGQPSSDPAAYQISKTGLVASRQIRVVQFSNRHSQKVTVPGTRGRIGQPPNGTFRNGRHVGCGAHDKESQTTTRPG